MIRLGRRGWELHRGSRCVACTPFSGARDSFWARLWLQQFKGDPAALDEIRRLVLEADTWWPLHKATADQTIEWMADLLAHGKWHVHEPVLPGGNALQLDENAIEEDIAEIVSALPAPKDRQERPKPPEEENLLPRNADEAAIAAAMKQAAALGIPFCEECARASLKRAREAA